MKTTSRISGKRIGKGWRIAGSIRRRRDVVEAEKREQFKKGCV